MSEKRVLGNSPAFPLGEAIIMHYSIRQFSWTALSSLLLVGLSGCSGDAGTGDDDPAGGAWSAHGGSTQSGSGGATVSGGASSGGISGAGGAPGSGGASQGGSSGGTASNGGSSAGGVFGDGKGGRGGAGRGSGGASSGGRAAGGTLNGGSSAGGTLNGGNSAGGKAAGGKASGGSSAGAASGGVGGDPFAASPTCTSGVTWKSGNGATMRPGEACTSCHSRFKIAGTVYPTGHEPNDCNGAGTSAAASIIITDANGTSTTLSVNAAGNFYSNTSIATPYTARVQTSKGTRAMTTPQTNGNCNSCHTQNGANGAPGRIVLP